MNIFLTGGTGFIGRHLLHLLGTTNHDVTALIRGTNVSREDSLRKQPYWLSKEMDKLDDADFAGVDVFVHLASVGVSPKMAAWNELLKWNVLVTMDLLEKAYIAGVRRYVLAGSFSEYGNASRVYDLIPPCAPLLPTSPYAASKAAGFAAAYAFACERNVELCYLRIFSAYGEGQYSENFWPSLRSAAINGEDFLMTPGQQIRDFVPVETVAATILDSIQNRGNARPGVPFVANVGSGRPMSLLEFAQKCWSEWGATGRIIAGAMPYRPNELMRVVPEVTNTDK